MPADVLVGSEVRLPLTHPVEILGSDLELASLLRVPGGVQDLHVLLARVEPGRWRFVGLDPEARLDAEGTCVEPDEITHGDRLRVGDHVLVLQPLAEEPAPERPRPSLGALDLVAACGRILRARAVPGLLAGAGRALLELLEARACGLAIAGPGLEESSLVLGDRACLEESWRSEVRTYRPRPGEDRTLATRERGPGGELAWVLRIPFVVPGKLGPDVRELGGAILCFDEARSWVDESSRRLATAVGYLVGAELARLSRELARPRGAATRVVRSPEALAPPPPEPLRGPPVEVQLDLRPVVVSMSPDAALRHLRVLPEAVLGRLPFNRVVIFRAGEGELAGRVLVARVGRRRGTFRQGVDSCRDPDPPSAEAIELVSRALADRAPHLRVYRPVAHPEIGSPEGGRLQAIVSLPVLGEGDGVGVIAVVHAESWHGEGRVDTEEVRKLRDLVADRLCAR